MKLDKSSMMVASSAMSSASPDFKQPSMSLKQQSQLQSQSSQSSYYKYNSKGRAHSDEHSQQPYYEQNLSSVNTKKSNSNIDRNHQRKPSTEQLSAKQMADELQSRFSYQRAAQSSKSSKPSQLTAQQRTENGSQSAVKQKKQTKQSAQQSKLVKNKSVNTKMQQKQVGIQQSSQDSQNLQNTQQHAANATNSSQSSETPTPRQCLGALDFINLPTDSYRQIPERQFMNSLLKHTAIGLVIIVSLAAITVYADEFDITNVANTNNSAASVGTNPK